MKQIIKELRRSAQAKKPWLLCDVFTYTEALLWYTPLPNPRCERNDQIFFLLVAEALESEL